MKKGKGKKKDRLLANLPPLKKVEGKLPYYFDLIWDVKYAEDLEKEGLKNNKKIQQALAQHGYDVREWLR